MALKAQPLLKRLGRIAVLHACRSPSFDLVSPLYLLYFSGFPGSLTTARLWPRRSPTRCKSKGCFSLLYGAMTFFLIQGAELVRALPGAPGYAFGFEREQHRTDLPNHLRGRWPEWEVLLGFLPGWRRRAWTCDFCMPLFTENI